MSALPWNGPEDRRNGFGNEIRRLLGDRESRTLGAAVVGQAALLSAVILSLSVIHPPVSKPIEDFRDMQVSLVEGRDATPKPSARIAAPETKAVQEQPKPDQAVDQAEKPSESTTASLPVNGPPSSGAGTIWTPPAPDPNAPLASTKQPEEGKRVVLPVVEMKKGAAEPQLVSYDQGRFSDAASVHEAARLPGNGNIVMTVSVDAGGDVTSCQTSVSSGSSILDGKACELVRSYKYRPGQDADGRPRAAVVSEVLEWARDGQFSPTGVAAGPASQAGLASVVRAMPKVVVPTAQGARPRP